jgi:NitT/TauT family transport system substrate-binding protein
LAGKLVSSIYLNFNLINMKEGKSSKGFVIILLVVVVGLASYFLFFNNPKEEAEEEKMDKVTLQLKWIEQAQFMGFLVAREMGYYEEENIDIEILPGGVGINPVDVLIAKNADVAVAWTGNVLPAISLGEELVNIGQGMQRSGMRLMALKESGIEKPSDIKGRQIGVWPGGNELEPYAFIEKQGLDRDRDVELVNQNFDMNQLLNGEIDLASAMVYNEYWLPIEAGYSEDDFVVFDMEQEGAGMLQDALFVRRDFLSENKDLLVRFMRASIKGWEYAIEDPERAVELMNLDFTANEVTAKDHQIRMAKETAKLYKADDGTTEGLFYINTTKLQQTIDIATEYIKEVEGIQMGDIYTLDIWREAIE